ncbi:MAG: NADH-quinone oxidoreductase subunit, partial [Aeromicrobium sp.]|nr:NADH-quinone oxidoreductase subunit [Aeromicrobium sp.]
PLQNQTMSHGYAETRFHDVKRTYPKPDNIYANILLDRERCVLCARCTRFSEQIAGDPFIAVVERGAQQQVGIYEKEPFSYFFSGNTIQICPVGALTSADYRFRSRPFDLVSTPSVAEHDASGSAIRVDHRRGVVVRRLAGDDPEVNEEWITDKDRFAFTYATQGDRIRTPLVRSVETGELEPASWPFAIATAARGLEAAGGKVGVLPGGRLTVEDAFAYSKFARTVLKTNDIDFRARAHSDEEAAFLAARVAATPIDVTFSDLERASTVVLVGLEPEDEAGSIFLRLRKGARERGLKVVAIASHSTRGLHKVAGELVRTAPGDEPAALAGLALDDRAIILTGERLAAVPGGFTAALDAAARSGARLAWVPRRAGDRGAVDAGCLPTLLPGGRPLGDAEARADLSAAWGVRTISARTGRDTTSMFRDAKLGTVKALLIGGVEIDDLPDPAGARAGLLAADFVVSLEVRASDVTAVADVVLPIAPTVEKPGSFVNWEGRVRPFEAVMHEPSSLTDIRVLAGIAEEMGKPLGFRTVAAARRAMAELGPWDGPRSAAPTVEPAAADAARRTVVLDTWRLMIDDARGQDGQAQFKATARPAVIRANEATLKAFDIDPGTPATVSTAVGSVTLPSEVADLPNGVVWAPANSGVSLRAALGAGSGDRVLLSTTSRGDES